MNKTWTLQRTVGPTAVAVSLEEAKAALRISQAATFSDDDLTQAIQAATEQFEQDTDRAVITQTYEHRDFLFPSGSSPILLSVKPVQAVSTLTYLDSDDNEVTLDAAAYDLDRARRQIFPVGSEWPATNHTHRGVVVTFTAGYGATEGSVPRLVKRAILLQVGKWFGDPMMETSDAYNSDAAYERIITKEMRTSYP